MSNNMYLLAGLQVLIQLAGVIVAIIGYVQVGNAEVKDFRWSFYFPILSGVVFFGPLNITMFLPVLPKWYPLYSCCVQEDGSMAPICRGRTRLGIVLWIYRVVCLASLVTAIIALTMVQLTSQFQTFSIISGVLVMLSALISFYPPLNEIVYCRNFPVDVGRQQAPLIQP